MPNDLELADVLSEFARTMVTDFPIQAILDHLVQRIVDVLPVTAAGVTLISPGIDPRYVAASNTSALRFEELQADLAEGPCVAAYEEGEAISVPDLRTDGRFPRFAPRAVEAGLMAVFTFPLRHDQRRLGALDLYRDAPGPLTPASLDAAQTLADVATSYLLNAQARADLQDSSDRSKQLSLHDALTGLPNRTLLLERLEHALLRCGRSGKTAAVLFADLDRFKAVNDQHGHIAGDDLLIEVARRLNAALRPGDTVSRFSGDEFVVLCEDLDDAAEVEHIAQRIVDSIAAPYHLAAGDVDLTASVGIAFIGNEAQLTESVLKDADAAMYQAKRKGGARHQIIDLREQSKVAERSSLQRELRKALDRGELRLDYQPIVDTRDGRFMGTEALLRWDNPKRGVVAPTLIIPLAEQSGLIASIGRWALERSCRDIDGWRRDTAGPDLGMSLNMSAHEIMAPDYAGTIAALLATAEMDPANITLELTESVFVHDSERALMVLRDLKGIGVNLALDDFGTGYSSLNYLQRFPIDVVKIDQSFVADLNHTPSSHAIVLSVINLAHLLGMVVVAEGVETAAQHVELLALGCDRCQGFYFAHPMSGADIATLLQEGSPAGDVHLPVRDDRQPVLT
jgi:diguanylate cyclase (GGDEF)-like protein